ncbi:MAG TPA: hypothetical protein VGM26_13600 [Rhizomicrobium sp.]
MRESQTENWHMERINYYHATHVDYEAAAAIFDPALLIELTIAIGLINEANRMAIGFRTTPASAK